MSLVVWLTGLSGSGKSALSLFVEEQLQSRGIPVAVLDGDIIRRTLSSDLGFSPEDRAESLRRISALARELADSGKVVLVAAISPYASVRDQIRGEHSLFLEVFVEASLATCESRDPKGLYKKARAGEIPDFTGISAPYEPPLHPDLTCRTDRESLEVSGSKILVAIDTAISVLQSGAQARAAVS